MRKCEKYYIINTYIEIILRRQIPRGNVYEILYAIYEKNELTDLMLMVMFLCKSSRNKIIFP